MIAAHQRGNWAELMAAAWFTQSGYEVYLGFGNTSADMIVVREGRTQRVEVKAASLTTGARPGNKTSPYNVSGVEPERFDVLVVVLPHGEVMLDPPLSLVYRAGRQPRRAA